jgi:ATP-dependent helicase HrpB
MGKLTLFFSYEFPYYQGKIEKIQSTIWCRMKQNEKQQLPIDDYLDEIVAAGRDYSTILVKASPGSGKTTRLPWALAKGLQKKVAVLEPRRLAAKLAAVRIADEESLWLGREIGYHFRLEKKASEETEVIFYTEGTFLKRFLSDPRLSDIDILVLDEFHERHLETDLALALARELQKSRDLIIILMSATLDLKLVEAFPNSRTFDIKAPHYPVDIEFLPNVPSVLDQPLHVKVKKAISETEGDTLVFLPGMREMLKVKSVLDNDVDTFLLHSELSREEQEGALGPSIRRKIILSTNIAESSVTIPGIKTVIDTGIQRSGWYSPWSGLKFIKDYPVTKSSAIQRAGRAGRTGPGKCLRLYSEMDFNERPEHTLPEIKKADLTDTILFLMQSRLTPKWFEEPDNEKVLSAKTLLEKLGATRNGEISEVGKKLLDYPVEVRLARVLLAAENLLPESKKKLVHFICNELEDDKTGTLQKRLKTFLNKAGTENGPWEKCLLSGFIDQVALYRAKHRDFIHYSGKVLKAHAGLHDLADGLYIIFDVTQRQEAIKIQEIQEEWAFDIDPFPFTEEEEVDVSQKIVLRRKTKLGSILIEEETQKITWQEAAPSIREKVLKDIQSLFEDKLNHWKDSAEFHRVTFWCKTSQKDLNLALEGVSLTDFLEQYGLEWEHFPHFFSSALENVLDLQKMNQELPREINLGGKRNLVIHYSLGQAPFVEAPIQEFYGQKETPTILGGKVPLTLRLLGPHKRPIQITNDLSGFWKKTYQEMKKEYQREYPKHYWPDTPWDARPYLLRSHLPKA